MTNVNGKVLWSWLNFDKKPQQILKMKEAISKLNFIV